MSLPQILGQFPTVRLRRTRRYEWSRNLVSETALSPKDLIWSVFVREESISPEITSMPRIKRYSVQELVEEARKAHDLGIGLLALFPVIENKRKSEDAKECLNDQGLIPTTVRALKQALPNLGIMTDVALDAYTSHGHDGLVTNGEILNDETVKLLAKHAIVHAKAGADVISPSDMMDGRVGVIRQALDSENFEHIQIMSYAAKYASVFYGPFRDALGSQSCLGKSHKKSYQLDPANANEALREVAQDIAEGADMVMVKPGLPYLDIVARVKDTFKVPTFAFQVSGEYAMLDLAAKAGWLDFNQGLMETLISFKRAGADGIITYGAVEAAQFIQKEPIKK